MRRNKQLILFFAIIMLALVGKSIAQDVKKAFATPEIVWYGLDFSKTRFIGNFNQFGEAGAKDGDDIKAKYIPGWNNLILLEDKKYDIKGTFNKLSMQYNLGPVEMKHASIDPGQMFSMSSTDRVRFKEGDVQAIVKELKTGTDKGVGLVFIVETFDKYGEAADLHITFFDIETKQVLLTKKMSGKPKGIGLRNYWAGAVYDILKQAKKEYPKWEKQMLK